MEYLQDIWHSFYGNKDAVCSFGMFVVISILLFFIFVISFLGCILPMLPGVLFAFLGVLIWKLTIGAEVFTWGGVFLCGLLTLLAQILDFWLPIKYTPTKSGAWGAFWGGIIWRCFDIYISAIRALIYIFNSARFGVFI